MSKEAGYTIAVLPGDGIGREVITEAEKVLAQIGELYGHNFAFEHALVGGAAMDATGEPLPESTLRLCKASDAVLFGAVGDPKYDDPGAQARPEQALLGLRQKLGLYANLRPVWMHPALAGASPPVLGAPLSADPPKQRASVGNRRPQAVGPGLRSRTPGGR